MLYYIKREIIGAEPSIPIFLDSLCLFLLMSFSEVLKSFSVKANKLRALDTSVYRCRERRIVRYIEDKCGVKFTYIEGDFPPDVFWKDYFQRTDFLPSSNNVVIDVGASLGDYAVIVAEYYKAKKVIAIEPEPSYFHLLVKNIKANNLQSEIIPFKLAAYNSDGEIQLYKSGPYLTSTSGEQILRCQSKKLDSLILELNVKQVDILKIDAEGSELKVLEGLKQTLRRFRPKIIVEVHSETLRSDVIRFLHPYRYRHVHEKANIHEPLISVLYFAPN